MREDITEKAKKKRSVIAIAEKYNKKYCSEIIEFFSKMRADDDGKIIGVPSMLSFSQKIGVSLPTLEKWRQLHCEFDGACCHASEMLRQLLVDAALSSSVNVTAAKFILANEFGMGASSKAGLDKSKEGLSEGDRRIIENLLSRLGDDL